MNRICHFLMTSIALHLTGVLFCSDALAQLQMNVDSYGVSGVSITSNNGYGGTTPYIKYQIPDPTLVNLQAPLISGGWNFYEWLGCTSTSGPSGSTCSLNMMTYNWSVIASYVNGFELSVQSTSASDVVITSSSGHGGTTNYTTLVVPETDVYLQAPLDVGDLIFSGWTGCDESIGTGCYVDMTNHRAVTANYILAPAVDDFVTTWQTDIPASSSDTSVTVPMIGGPYYVDWNGDGSFDEWVLGGEVTHDYGVAGTYTIRIRGAYESIRFDGKGDAAKILTIDQWGTNLWTTMYRSFFGQETSQFPHQMSLIFLHSLTCQVCSTIVPPLTRIPANGTRHL